MLNRLYLLKHNPIQQLLHAMYVYVGAEGTRMKQGKGMSHMSHHRHPGPNIDPGSYTYEHISPCCSFSPVLSRLNTPALIALLTPPPSLTAQNAPILHIVY